MKLDGLSAHLSPDIAQRAFWATLREHVLPLRPSQYDITSVCNLACEGCLFFSGSDYLEHRDADDMQAVEMFFDGEATRGVRYGYFGGAEPSLAEGKLAIAARHLPYGVVFTNGTKRLTDEIPYRVHVSVWGRPERSKKLRGASILGKQLANYRGDRRAVFVFTITGQNIDDIGYIAEVCSDNGVALTFNHYSPTAKYMDFVNGRARPDQYHAGSQDRSNLLLNSQNLERSREAVECAMNRHGDLIIYDQEFSDLIHDSSGLYPDIDPSTATARDCGVRLTSSLHHYNTDLSRSDAKCCSPNIECSSCRLYAQSFATLLTRATREIRRPGGLSRLIRLWRLWCMLFISDDRVNAVAAVNEPLNRV